MPKTRRRSSLSIPGHVRYVSDFRSTGERSTRRRAAVVGGTGMSLDVTSHCGSSYRTPNGRRRQVPPETRQALQMLGMRSDPESDFMDEAEGENEKDTDLCNSNGGHDQLAKEKHWHNTSGRPSNDDSHGQLMLPWYCPPVQRQLWEDEQVLPHVNWHDLFFDLAFVAAAYNLGGMLITTMNEHYWQRGMLYLVAMFGSLYSIWENDMVYASRYTLVDYSHRLASIWRFLCVSFAVVSIKPIHLLGATHGTETFVFCLSLFCESLLRLVLNLELYLYGDGDRKAIQNQTKRETLYHVLPTTMAYKAATVIAGYSAFYAEKVDSDSSTPATDNYSNSTSAYQPNLHRRLAAEVATETDWNLSDVALMICLGAYLFNILLDLYQRSTYNKQIHAIQDYFVPNNIDYMIHRYGEWTMLIIGEGILSLLIVDTVEAEEYYEIIGLGCLTVIVLQMLKFESQPAHADGHALWRSMKAATMFSVFIQVMSMALVAFGVCYKVMLKDVIHDNDPKYGSHYSGADETMDAHVTATVSHHRVLDSVKTSSITPEANATLFLMSLSVVLICLELLTVTHKGVAETFYLLFQVPGHAPSRMTPNWPFVFILIVKLVVLIYTATMALWVTDPLEIAVAGFLVVLAMATIRIIGWSLFHRRVRHHDAPNALDATTQQPGLEKLAFPQGEDTESTVASMESTVIATIVKKDSVRQNPNLKSVGNFSILPPVTELDESAHTQKDHRQPQQAPRKQSNPRTEHARDTLASIWIEYTDPESGEKYYSNKIGDTTWEKPSKGKIVQGRRLKAGTKLTVQHSISKIPPMGWGLNEDSDTGKKHNKPPIGERQCKHSVADNNDNLNTYRDRKKSKLPKGWMEFIDTDSGDTYYYSQTTGKSTWDRPSFSTDRKSVV